MTDPIVDEIRSTRERLSMQSGGDIHSIAMAARERQKRSGTRYVTNHNRERGPDCSGASPTPPEMRVRIRRFNS